jgi:hypothetical protein
VLKYQYPDHYNIALKLLIKGIVLKLCGIMSMSCNLVSVSSSCLVLHFHLRSSILLFENFSVFGFITILLFISHCRSWRWNEFSMWWWASMKQVVAAAQTVLIFGTIVSLCTPLYYIYVVSSTWLWTIYLCFASTILQHSVFRCPPHPLSIWNRCRRELIGVLAYPYRNEFDVGVFAISNIHCG